MMVICATIKVVRPVHGWEEDKYIGTSPYMPLLSIRFSGENMCNVFDLWGDESEILSFKFPLDQKLGEIQWLSRSRWCHLLDIMVLDLHDILGGNMTCIIYRKTKLQGWLDAICWQYSICSCRSFILKCWDVWERHQYFASPSTEAWGTWTYAYGTCRGTLCI